MSFDQWWKTAGNSTETKMIGTQKVRACLPNYTASHARRLTTGMRTLDFAFLFTESEYISDRFNVNNT
jgi:hypothetical protein